MTKKEYHRKKGFSIIEAAIGITIFTLVSSISYNQFLNQRPDMAINKVAWQLMSELRLARATAIAQNTRAVVTLAGERLSIKTDQNGDGLYSEFEHKHVNFISEGITFTRSQTDQVAFTGSGRFIKNTEAGPLSFETITLSHPETRNRWTITIYSNGQVKLDKSDD